MTQAGSDVQDLYVLTKSGDGYTLDSSTKAFETRALDVARRSCRVARCVTFLSIHETPNTDV
jgi:hypothetical protein